jgi:hypothetical protein
MNLNGRDGNKRWVFVRPLKFLGGISRKCSLFRLKLEVLLRGLQGEIEVFMTSFKIFFWKIETEKN